MKKDMIFAPAMLIISILLFLYGVTGLGVHIAISVVGFIVLGVYTSLTRKEWKTPALELSMRAFYGITLITGIILKIAYLPALSIAHKAAAAIFVVLLVVLFVKKIIANKK